MLQVTATILLLVALNGLFVAAELALISVPKASIERAALSGNRMAHAVLALLQNPRKQDRYIAASQVGITLASLGLGMYGEEHLASGLDALLTRIGVPTRLVSSACAVAGLTFLHIVLGEIVPKTLSLRHPEGTVLWVSTPMRWLNVLFWPLVMPLEAAGNALLRGLGVQRGHTNEAPTTEALRFMVAESAGRGVLGSATGAVMKDLFAWSELTAAQVMLARQRVVGLPVGATPAYMHGLVRSAPHSRYPVYEGTLDGIVGMVMIRDVLKHLLAGTALSAHDIRPLPFVPGTARLDLVLSRMRSSQTQMAVVMDEQGGTAGILTSEDLFDEVVGQVSDGAAALAPVYQEAGEYYALGVARIEQVAKQLGLDLTHPEVDTVSGLVLTLLDRPPAVGDVVSFCGMQLKVRSVEGRGVKECVVRVDPGVAREKDHPL